VNQSIAVISRLPLRDDLTNTSRAKPVPIDSILFGAQGANRVPRHRIRSSGSYDGFLDLLPGMNFLMTASAQRNEIGFGIVTEVTAWLDVVNLKVSTTSTILAAPSIALKYLAPQFSVGPWAELQSGASVTRSVHEATRVRSRNSCFWGCGRRP